MNKPNIQTTKQVVPMLYGYSTPEVVRHNGWTKIGYTEQDVETRINQQTHTADVKWHLEWKGNATFDDGSGETFIDKDFHAYLRKSGIEQENGKNNEWFHVDGTTSKQMFRDFREDHGIIKTTDEADRMIDKLHTNYEIERNVIENQRVAEQQARYETGKTSEQIDKEFEKKQKEAMEKFNEELTTAISDFARESTKETVKTVETKKKEREKETIEDGVRDHLRGFSRTIPSFLMAYGDNTVTLATFDTIIPDKVFLEVTSITLDQFKFLRDGGDYVEEETGQTKHFDGQLFDSVVFDDSVKEFLALKKKLADYFDEKSVEDIFDYIPPQKTNQIFTPKTMVKKMVDMLEQENPGCFDMPDKTFIDLYMKSGLYITEIVKRLYQSDEMKKQFPDNKERLKHIFEKQVYGLAPTEIIYKIATSYILGFDEDTKNIKHKFRQLDALPYAKDGTLEQVLDELYSEDE